MILVENEGNSMGQHYQDNSLRKCSSTPSPDFEPGLRCEQYGSLATLLKCLLNVQASLSIANIGHLYVYFLNIGRTGT